jgi:hypothetical protein
MGLFPGTTLRQCLLGGSSLFHRLVERKMGVGRRLMLCWASGRPGPQGLPGAQPWLPWQAGEVAALKALFRAKEELVCP